MVAISRGRTSDEDQQADGTAPIGHLDMQELVFDDADVVGKRETEWRGSRTRPPPYRMPPYHMVQLLVECIKLLLVFLHRLREGGSLLVLGFDRLVLGFDRLVLGFDRPFNRPKHRDHVPQ